MLVIDLNAPTPSNTLGHLPRRVAAFVAPLMDHHVLENAEPSSQLFRVSSDGGHTKNDYHIVSEISFNVSPPSESMG